MKLKIITTTKMICNISGTVKVIGIPSRTEYIFTDQNKILEIKNEDVSDLLSKKHESGCCGNKKTIYNIFEIVK